MADRYRFTWEAFDGVEHYSLFEDGVEIVSNIVGTDFDLLFQNVDAGTHQYQLKGYNNISEVVSPILEITYSPLVGEIQGFQYSIV
jgi:hypothetical protein